MALHPVIMAGGSGTRFWPLSRKARPKQFLPLASKKPLLVETADRLRGLARPQNTWVVCGPQHARPVRKLLPKLPPRNVLVEPVARNTAPAIALACAHVAHQDPEGVLLVLPSDHHIADVKGFVGRLAAAAKVAEQGQIVTLGITPSRPDTGYGYIRVGPPLSGEAFKVAAFVEKPDAQTAVSYLASGQYLWNGGIFVFRADVMLEAFRRHMPEVWKGLEKLRAAIGTRAYPSVLARVFPRMPSTSIDYGVAERAQNIAVIPGEFGWSDVGSFAAIAEVRSPDADGNVVEGPGTLAIDSKGCVVLGSGRVVAVVGMTDVVVVDAGDALLVIPKERSQDVRKAVEALKARKLEAFL
jgi:mannose-1-phosphate guanylyltransferase